MNYIQINIWSKNRAVILIRTVFHIFVFRRPDKYILLRRFICLIFPDFLNALPDNH